MSSEYTSIVQSNQVGQRSVTTPGSHLSLACLEKLIILTGSPMYKDLDTLLFPPVIMFCCLTRTLLCLCGSIISTLVRI